MSRKNRTRGKSENSKKTQARKRAEVILKVQGGLCTASEGASELEVSRKTFYKWQNKAFEAVASALEEKGPGRPAPSPEELKIKQLEEELENARSQLEMAERRERLKDEAWELKIELERKKMKKK